MDLKKKKTRRTNSTCEEHMHHKCAKRLNSEGLGRLNPAHSKERPGHWHSSGR